MPNLPMTDIFYKLNVVLPDGADIVIISCIFWTGVPKEVGTIILVVLPKTAIKVHL
jgi:hypothetical protein